jgi:hypothetical protein
MASNMEILAKLDAAFKGITEISDFGDSILQPEKFDRFVRTMEHAVNVLPNARFIRMDAQKSDIDRTGFVGRILKAGRAAAQGGGAVVELNASTHGVTPTPVTNQLIARELVAITSLRDDALRRNIERGGFEDTLLDLFGGAAGRDLEEYCLLGDTGVTYGTDDVLSQTDGWIKLAGNKIYGAGAGKDFDPAASSYPENMFDAMLAALPKQYLVNVQDWEYEVTWEVYNAYHNLLKARGTALGDTAQVGMPQLYYKGIKVKYVPTLERAATSGASDDGLMNGKLALLTNPDNMAYGVFHDVMVEREREAKARRTDFVLSFEGDAHYEDENASVAALIQKESA